MTVKIPVKRTFDVNKKFKDACAAKGYVETQHPFPSVEIMGSCHTSFRLIVEWESESEKHIETEEKNIKSAIQWILWQ